MGLLCGNATARHGVTDPPVPHTNLQRSRFTITVGHIPFTEGTIERKQVLLRHNVLLCRAAAEVSGNDVLAPASARTACYAKEFTLDSGLE